MCKSEFWVAALFVIEAYLGRTARVKSSSLLELVFRVGLQLLTVAGRVTKLTGENMPTTKNTKELLDLVLAGYSIVQQAQADGKVDIADMGLLLGLIPIVGPAFEDVSLIPAELKDMDAAEAADLISHVMGKLSVSDPKARSIIDASFKFALSGFQLYKAVTSPAA